MTTEERLNSLEGTQEYHDARIGLLESIAERLLVLIEETKRDSAVTQRLWVQLAKRYGWLDDDDLASG